VSQYRDEPRPDPSDWSASVEDRDPDERWADDYDARSLRSYDPIHPQGFGISTLVRRLWAVLIAVIVAAFKFGAFAIKFFGIFISVAAYALIWGWRFAVGFVALILIHEAGHYLEARRQGLRPALPVFIPFLGAYVAIKDAPRDPWRNGLISLAGPIVGGAGAAAFWLAGEAMDSRLLGALAFSGFLLNLINLLPFPPLDGGFAWGAIRALTGRHADPAFAGRRGQGYLLAFLYVGIAALLVAGAVASHVPQDRL
jgi:Zn-dependent protease